MNLPVSFGETPLEEEERDGLRAQSISTRGELDEFEQRNIEKAVEWSLKAKFSKEKILSVEFVQEVHRRMFSEVWLWAGTFRKTNKNIGVDTLQIREQLAKLCMDCRYWIDHATYREDEIGVRFKYKLVSIHPFPNGNGRHSRFFADILISQIFARQVFSWGGRNLTDPDETRQRYIGALKQADEGNFEPLIGFARS